MHSFDIDEGEIYIGDAGLLTSVCRCGVLGSFVYFVVGTFSRYLP
jgi:hypothetical protein